MSVIEQTPIARRRRVPENVALIPGLVNGVFDNTRTLNLPDLGEFVGSSIVKLSDPFVNLIQFYGVRNVSLLSPAPIPFVPTIIPVDDVMIIRLFHDDFNTTFSDSYNPWLNAGSFSLNGSVSPVEISAAPVFAVQALVPAACIDDATKKTLIKLWIT